MRLVTYLDDAGAYPETFVALPGVREMILKEGSDGQLSYIPAAQRMVIEEYETQLQLLSQDNTRALSGVDPARMAIVQKSARDCSNFGKAVGGLRLKCWSRKN